MRAQRRARPHPGPLGGGGEGGGGGRRAAGHRRAAALAQRRGRRASGLCEAGRREEKRRGFIEVDAESATVNVYGSGAEWVLPERCDPSSIGRVSFDCVLFSRIGSHFVPRLATLPALRSLRLCRNGVSSLGQLAQLCALPCLTELEIEENRVLLRRTCSAGTSPSPSLACVG